MKKVIVAVLMMMAMALLSSATMAEDIAKSTLQQVQGVKSHIVRKGDTLWKIGKEFGVDPRAIARLNNLKNPHLIHPGQKLIIPQSSPYQWRSVGDNPYIGTWQWAISHFNLPSKIKVQFRQKIQRDEWQWLEPGLQSGQRLEAVTFGKKGIKRNVICAWPEDEFYAAKDYSVGEYRIIKVLWCGNWAWWKEEKKPLPEPKRGLLVEKKPTPELKPEAPLPAGPKEDLFDEAFDEQQGSCPDCDLILGAGVYELINWDGAGAYAWAKARCYFFENRLNGTLLKWGLFGFGASGDGYDDDYDYRWRELVIGPTIKPIGDGWDADIDLGLIGRLWNKGGIGSYHNYQVDDVFLLSTHGNFYSRREEGKKWWPRTELNLEWRLTYNEDHKYRQNGYLLDPEPYDNQWLEIMLKQGIYDYQIDQDWLITPGLNLGYVREYGKSEPNFLQFGPTVTLSWFGQDIVSISPLNYKKQLGDDGDQLHWISGWIDIGGIVKAIKASRIEKPTEEDLTF